MEDKRRRQYVPLDSHIAFGKTGTALEKRWGLEGLCTWMLFLAACKRGTTQGEFSYISEEDGWGQLGGKATLFTLDDFFKTTGTLKQTRRRRVGRIKYVQCTRWGDWNDSYRRQTEREQKSRKRGENTPDNRRTLGGTYADDVRDEGEGDSEGEYEGEVVGQPHPGENLPFEKQLLATKLKALTPVSEEGAGQIDALCSGLSQGSLAKVLESCNRKAGQETLGPGYVIAALRSERNEAA